MFFCVATLKYIMFIAVNIYFCVTYMIFTYFLFFVDEHHEMNVSYFFESFSVILVAQFLYAYLLFRFFLLHFLEIGYRIIFRTEFRKITQRRIRIFFLRNFVRIVTPSSRVRSSRKKYKSKRARTSDYSRQSFVERFSCDF